ncbi:unnamed protein product [Urochloa decumbens]|uniref:Phytocyanin domain-containing protein n=1 Tax=Urochloa decumbens TaxID=240449 RepID=A0ABC9ADQ6_9POAL
MSQKMRTCSSNASLILAWGFAAFLAASAATTATHGGVFYVGDKADWVGKPAVSYDRWAARHHFKVADTLVFKYKKGADSVLVVDKHRYETCDEKDPIDELRDGDSAYMLGRTGPFYFITGDAGRCKQGQKLMVIVTAETAEPPAPGSQAPSPSSFAPPYTSIAATPEYYITDSFKPCISRPVTN